MEEFIKLMQLWTDYLKGHPKSDFADFCRFYLANHIQQATKVPGAKLPKPTTTDSLFMMTVTRSTLSFWVYMRIALRDTDLPAIEDIMVCSALFQLGESRKTDVINHAMMEISTGTDILNRLIKKGFVHQRVDPDDKRSKLLTLTASGTSTLKKCFAKAGMAREFFLADLTETDKKLVAKILDPLQEKHSRLAVASKGKTIEEIHAEIFKKRTNHKR
ncbi:MAG TPA: winged helix DNA-binding protein [Cyclobacteriaceae bacterium]|nr:winged helix DNA-binding protein [Cyclobacteriaceae bacterium]